MNLFSIGPILVLVSVAIAIVVWRRRSYLLRLIAMLSGYFLWVVFASALAFLGTDEFGLRFVPLITITAPWYFIPGFPSPHNLPVLMILGACIIASCLSVLAALIGYPRYTPLPLPSRRG